MKCKLRVTSLLAAGLLSANAAQASLVSAGTGLVYDNVANVTWSSNANLFGTMLAGNANLVNQIIAAVPTVHDTPNSGDTPPNSGARNLSAAWDFNGTGTMSWWGGLAWTQYLNSISYLGHNTWMMPVTYDQTCPTSGCTNSMLGELFYTGLGGVAGQSITTTHNASYGVFTNVQSFLYWSGTESAGFPLGAWCLGMDNGDQLSGYLKGSGNYSWVVFPGNAAAAPEPAGLALFAIGLLGLMTARRRFDSRAAV